MKVDSSINDDSDDEEDKNTKWHKSVRRHTFSELSEERYILSINDSEETPKARCKKLIKQGLLIEENEMNLKYLIKKENEAKDG